MRISSSSSGYFSWDKETGKKVEYKKSLVEILLKTDKLFELSYI